MISNFRANVKRNYYFYRAKKTNYKNNERLPFECDSNFFYGYSLQVTSGRACQHEEDYYRSKAIGIDINEGWFEQATSHWPVSFGEDDFRKPYIKTRQELSLILIEEFKTYGGLLKDGGKLWNKFIPVSPSIMRNFSEQIIVNDSEFPDEIMREIQFSFFSDQATPYDEFIKNLKAFQKEIYRPRIKDKEIVLKTNTLVVQYEKYNYEKADFDEPREVIRTENKKGFTAGELLYKLHKTIGPILEREDNRYFEGLTFATIHDEEFPGLPVYFLDTGT